jgi:hypothetical protein
MEERTTISSSVVVMGNCVLGNSSLNSEKMGENVGAMEDDGEYDVGKSPGSSGMVVGRRVMLLYFAHMLVTCFAHHLCSIS